MTERHALVIDDDKGFAELVGCALATVGLTVVQRDDLAQCLETVADLQPEIVFLSDALSGAAAAGDRIKALTPATAVVRVGQAPADSAPGADLYLDKRTIASEADLLRTTESLRRPAPEPSADEALRMRREFDARREARATQSTGNLALHEHEAGQEAEITRLQQEVLAREQRIVVIQKKRHRIVSELADALRQSRKSYRDLEVLLDSAQSTADTALSEREELERFHGLEHQEHADALANEERRRAAESSLAGLRMQLSEAQRRAAQDLAALREEHGKALEDSEMQHQESLRRGAEELRAARARAADRERELRLQHEARMATAATEAMKAEDEHRKALHALETRLRAEKDEAVAALHAARLQAQSAQDKEHMATVRRSADELAAQKSVVQEREAALRLQEAKLAEALASLRTQAEAHERNSAALESRLRDAHASELSARQAEHEKKELELKRRHELHLADAEVATRRAAEEHQRALALLETRLLDEKKQALAALEAAGAEARAESERQHRLSLQQAADDRAEQTRAAERKEQELRRHFGAQLAEAAAETRALAETHRQAVAALELARTQALAVQDKEHAAVARRAAEELAAQKAAAQQKHDAALLLEARLAQAESRRAEAERAGAAALQAAQADGEARLAALRQEHEQARVALETRLQDEARARVAELEAAHEQLLSVRHAVHESALREREDARAAAEAEAARRESLLRQQHEAQSAEIQQQSAAVETQRQSEHAQELAAREAAQAEALRQALLERETLRETSERQAIEARRDQEARFAELEARLRAEKDQAVAAVEAARAQALAALDREHVAALRRATEEQAALRSALAEREATLVELEARMAAAEAEQAQRRVEQEEAAATREARLTGDAATERLQQGVAAREREDALRQEYEHRLAELEAEARLRASTHAEELAALESHGAEERDRALAAKDEEREQLVREQARKLADLMLGVQQQESELRQLYEDKLAQRDAARVQALAAQDKEHVATLRRLTEELNALRAAKPPGPS